MVILLHVIAALSSIALSGYSVIRPQKSRIRLSYILVGFTLGSGTYLIVSQHARMLQTCISGLVYLAFNFSCLTFAVHRLNQAKE
jgi:hypothetical protein